RDTHFYLIEELTSSNSNNVPHLRLQCLPYRWIWWVATSITIGSSLQHSPPGALSRTSNLGYLV
ncbi:Uncharacterized protein APZ42_008753, partial [Daphnia magna]